MPKAPAFQFYPNDWLRDTLELSLEARGAWITILCKMWYADVKGTLRLTRDQFARMLGVSPDEFDVILNELRVTQICNVVTERNGNITLENRRMSREFNERESNKIRQQRYRSRRGETVTEVSDDSNGGCNGKITALSSSSSSSSSSELKRLIHAAIAKNSDIDARLVEVAVIETMMRRKGSWNEHEPVKSVSYFDGEILKMKRSHLSNITLDALLHQRRRQIGIADASPEEEETVHDTNNDI